MASYFNLTLDTTAPTGGSIALASITSTRSIVATLAATGATQMKIYGDVGTGAEATTEAAATWETFATSKTIQLTSGDGSKTVNVKYRDSVGNESTTAAAITTLDTNVPIVTITGPDLSTISKATGYNVSAFSFVVGEAFAEYKVKAVPASDSLNTAGVQIPTTAGSTNMSGAGTFPADTAINCTIYGSDLETASAGDGAKIIKVFAKDSTGNWSV